MSRAIHKMRGGAQIITAIDGGRVDEAANLSVYTIAQTWAAVGPGRVIVANVMSTGIAGGTTLNSVTIGGISATILVAIMDTGDVTIAAIAVAFVPTGTSGDVVVTFSSQMVHCSVDVVTLYNVASVTPTFTGTDTTNISSSVSVASVTVESGGVVLGSVGRNATTAFTWSNLTERSDDIVDLGSRRAGTAFDVAADFTSPSTVSVSSGSLQRFAVAVMSLR